MWNNFANLILNNRLLIFCVICTLTVLLAFQIKNVKLSYKESSLLPDEDSTQLKYEHFQSVFPQENNRVLFAVDASVTLKQNFIEQWKEFYEKVKSDSLVYQVISFHDFQILEKDTANFRFNLNYINESEFIKSKKELSALELLRFFPFYRGLLLDDGETSLSMIAFLDLKYINTIHRAKWVERIENYISDFKNKTGVDVKFSGMPVIRTLNAKTIISELGLFVILALIITLSIFYFFFRSFLATVISALVVSIAVIWAYASLGFFGFQITIFTAIIPPLIIVIGVPNCVFFINRYYQELIKHKVKTLALKNTIAAIGNAILFTNITTAFGFFTFVFTKSKFLQEFGIIASINIMGTFVLSITIIPLIYSIIGMPNLEKKQKNKPIWVLKLMNFFTYLVFNKQRMTLTLFGIIFLFSLFGISRIDSSTNMLDDLPKEKNFFKDIMYFDNAYHGILPVEIYIESNKKNVIFNLSFLRKMDSLENWIKSQSNFSSSLSVLNFIKFSRQSFYNNNKEFYGLPTLLDKNVIYRYLQKSKDNIGLMRNYVDLGGSIVRVSCFIRNVDGDEMDRVYVGLNDKLKEIFPKNSYDSFTTGSSYLFYKGTDYFTKSILVSLGLAVCFISIFMAITFRSILMSLITLIPNLFPIIFTASVMGIFEIPLKPSTVLVFSVAFGISVDDTIHYLAKLRQELQWERNNLEIAIKNSLIETGTSMFYTSIVLFFGFGVFLFSGYGGTVALGGLSSITLLLAMMSNLLFLPILILVFKKHLSFFDNNYV